MNAAGTPPEAGADPADLGVRFARARAAAVTASLRDRQVVENEAEAVLAVSQAERGDLERRAYWNAWRLGRSRARAFGAVESLDELATLVGGLGLDCFEGTWEREPGRLRLTRSGCASSARGDARYCDFCREAMDGLVSGLSEGLHFVRHASLGNGAPACEDVLCETLGRGALLAPVPPQVSAYLAPPLTRLADLGARFEILGFAENRIYVTSSGSRTAACGPVQLYLDLLERHLRARFPEMTLVDASPRAVMA